MNKEQAKKVNQEKSLKAKKLRQDLGIKEYEQRYVGKFKGHIKKVKALFHNPKIQDTYTNQIDSGLANFILTSKNPN